jgi:hypothetical protein
MKRRDNPAEAQQRLIEFARQLHKQRNDGRTGILASYHIGSRRPHKAMVSMSIRDRCRRNRLIAALEPLL